MTATTVARGTRATAPVPRRAEPPARERHLRVVRTPATRRARRTRRRVVMAVAVAILTVLTVVAFHVLLAQSQIALDQLEQRTAAAEARYQEQRLKHDELTSPTRIVPMANELGLALPGQPPTAIQVPGTVTPPPRATSSTLKDVQDVKQALSEP